MWNNMNNYFRLFIGSCVFLRETVRFVFGAVYSARMTMITHGCTMISHMCILICDTLLHCTAETRLVNDLEWNRQSGFAMYRKNKLPFPTWRSYSNFIQVTWRTQLGCDAVFMTSSPSGSLRFFLLALIFPNVTFRRFQLQLWKAPFCSDISFHLFIITYSPAFTIP